MNTADRATEFIRNSTELAQKDGDIIAVLHKAASDLKDECQKYKELAEQKDQEINKMKKTASEDNTSETQEAADKGLDEENFRSVLRKMADEDLVDTKDIDQHVEVAKNDPDHIVKMMGVLNDQLAEVQSKTASENQEMESIGQPRNVSGNKNSDKLSKAGFEAEADQSTKERIADLDRELGSLMNSQ